MIGVLVEVHICTRVRENKGESRIFELCIVSSLALAHLSQSSSILSLIWQI